MDGDSDCLEKVRSLKIPKVAKYMMIKFHCVQQMQLSVLTLNKFAILYTNKEDFFILRRG